MAQGSSQNPKRVRIARSPWVGVYFTRTKVHCRPAKRSSLKTPDCAAASFTSSDRAGATNVSSPATATANGA